MAETFALVTPSYWRDLEQCRLLVESVDRWVPESVPHYLVVTRADRPLFEPMAGSRRKIIVVEDILPWWLIRLHVKSPIWLSLRTRPVKNWIVQQIVKFAVPAVVTEDVLYYADSDMFFVKPFDPAGQQRDGATPLFDETGQSGLIPDNMLWQNLSADLLGLPRLDEDDDNYVDQLVPMRRDLMLSMLARVEAATGKPWQVAIARLWRFSEYTLYGVYCQRVATEGGFVAGRQAAGEQLLGHRAARPSRARGDERCGRATPGRRDDIGEVAHAE